MITTIVFDLLDVYLTGFSGMEKRLSEDFGFNLYNVNIRVYKTQEFRLFMEGKISEEEFWKRIGKTTGWDFELPFLKSVVRDNFIEIRGTREIIEQLKENRYKLGLLSDHSKEWVDYCNRKFDYHKLFHSTQYSFEVGCCKVDKRAFELLLEKLKEKPENCLFIDDNENNVALARSLGFNAIQFKNPEQLKKDLATFSVRM